MIDKKLNIKDPFEIVDLFEATVANFFGAKYGISTDSCTNGIFLCLKYLNAPTEITIPLHTYLSIPMAILNAGYKLKIEKKVWRGMYELAPLEIFDAAGIWRKNSMSGKFTVLSFQHKKVLSLGRGGMILTNDKNAYDWLIRARYDGRTPGIPHKIDNVTQIGYHMYMTPEQAADGLLKFEKLVSTDTITHTNEDYKPLTEYTIFCEYK